MTFKMMPAMLLALLPAVVHAQVSVQLSPTVDAPVVTVSATESVDSAPDLATVSAGVSTLAPTAVAALQQNGVRMQRVIAAVRAAGVAAADIQTRGRRLCLCGQRATI